MITGKVSEEPKNAYLSVAGNGFRSSWGGFSIDGTSLDSGTGRGSTLAVHLVGSNIGVESSNALTSLMDPSMSKSKPK